MGPIARRARAVAAAAAVALALALAPLPRALCAAEEGAADFDAAADPANAAESAEAALARRRSEYVHGPRPHPLTDMAPSMEGVAVTYTLPAVDKLVFPAGEPVSVLAGVHNGGAHAINVSMAIASLNAAYDFSLHVQNFSAALYGTAVEVGQEASFAYTFVPAASLRPSEFFAAVTLFYHDSELVYTDTFFNETFELVERPGVDSELLLMAGTAAALVVFGAFAYNFLGDDEEKAAKAAAVKARAEAKARAAAPPSDGTEWLKGTAADAAGAGATGGGGGHRRGKKKGGRK